MVKKVKRAVFLDRDGVINRAVVIDGKPYPPDSLETMEILPGVVDALKRLHQAGWMLIVVTNQPDVARGKTTRESVEAINGYLAELLPIDEFRTCFHDSADHCDCRKPMPGALISASKMHRIDLGRSYMVGDRWRDIEAGQRAGCKTVFIDYGYDEKQPDQVDIIVNSLHEATNLILGETN